MIHNQRDLTYKNVNSFWFQKYLQYKIFNTQSRGEKLFFY